MNEPIDGAVLDQARHGDQVSAARAMGAIVEHYRPLVHYVARRLRGLGLPYKDLVAEGNLGLIRAAEKFDPSKQTRFSTYATYWIDHCMRRALDSKGQIIRIPSGTVEKVRKYRRLITEMEQELGRPPTDREVAREMDLGPGQVRKLRHCDVSAFTLSCADPDSDAKQSIESFAQEDDTVPYGGLMTEDSRHLLEELLGRLDEREHTILTLYFGLTAEGPHTFARIGARIGLSSERVRQIQKAALARLRKLAEPLREDLQPLLVA